MLAVEVHIFTDLHLLLASIETRHPFGCKNISNTDKVQIVLPLILQGPRRGRGVCDSFVCTENCMGKSPFIKKETFEIKWNKFSFLKCVTNLSLVPILKRFWRRLVKRKLMAVNKHYPQTTPGLIKIFCITWRFVGYNIHLQKWTVITVTNIWKNTKIKTGTGGKIKNNDKIDTTDS